jgi:hypothetical protein
MKFDLNILVIKQVLFELQAISSIRVIFNYFGTVHHHNLTLS